MATTSRSTSLLEQLAVPRAARFRSLGTTVTVATVDPAQLGAAKEILEEELDALDRACSRFRADAEIWSVTRGRGRAIAVSPLLFAAIETACDVASLTGGAVDPTVGAAVTGLGYDRDFAAIEPDRATADYEPVAAKGWWTIDLDRLNSTVKVPDGVLIDLGSSAKAFVADRSAALIAEHCQTGALVSVGGDIAVAGEPPVAGWQISVAHDSAVAPTNGDSVVTIARGGVASSSTVVRTWRRGGRQLHHIVDPSTGDVASDRWALVTVAAPTCTQANALTTAAVVWGDDAVDRLRGYGHPARLVSSDGELVTLCGWPPEDALGRDRP